MADAREVGRRFIEAFNAHDQQRMRQLNADNTLFEAPGEVKIEGGEAASEYAMGWVRAFPDARITVHNEVMAGDWGVQEFTFTGTHQETLISPAGEIPPTHKTLSGRAVQIFRDRGRDHRRHAALFRSGSGDDTARTDGRAGDRLTRLLQPPSALGALVQA